MLAAAIPGALPGCADPPVEWPESSPFPTDEIQLGMTFAELRIARPGISANSEDGSIQDVYYGGTLHYGFNSSGANGPLPRSRLVYVDVVRTDEARERAEKWWSSSVADLSAELGAEARCSTVRNGRLTWRRATLRPPDSPLAAAVELHIVSDAPGSGTGTLTTRMWLPKHASPPIGDDAATGAGNRLPGWEPCEAPSFPPAGSAR